LVYARQVFSLKLDFVKILVKVTEALLTRLPTMKLSVISAIILIGKQVIVTLKHRVGGQLLLVALRLKVSCCYKLRLKVNPFPKCQQQFGVRIKTGVLYSARISNVTFRFRAAISGMH